MNEDEHKKDEALFHAEDTKMTRRRMIQYSAGMAAAAFAAGLMPPNVQRALAEEPQKRPSMKDIKHVVLLMQENRSFDHYFGTMAGVRGFDDPDAMKLPDGKSVFHQPAPENPDGYLLPFHLDTKSSRAQQVPSTSHSWLAQHGSWNEGKMDSWVKVHRKINGPKGAYTMGHYKRDDIPFQFALAEAFTICDAYHCSLMGPTAPNRMYWMTGTIDPDGKAGGPMTSNRVPAAGFGWTTYAERLEKAGVSWKVYQELNNYSCNPLEKFASFKNAPKDSPLYEKGMYRGPADQFEKDAMNDNLPAVSWIIPTNWQSEHPRYMPVDGAAFVASKINAIAANPEVWKKTVFILNYDENDGLFDHVPPIVPPEGTEQEFVGKEPIGSGFRVPCVIISPWTAGGWVCSEPFDHTSVLQFLEQFTGVREENLSDWRRETFGNLTSAFRFEDDKAKWPRDVPNTENVAQHAKDVLRDGAELPKIIPIPGSDQTMPTQEKGGRKRVPSGKEREASKKT